MLRGGITIRFQVCFYLVLLKADEEIIRDNSFKLAQFPHSNVSSPRELKNLMNMVSEPLSVYIRDLGRLGIGKKSEKKQAPVFSKARRGRY